jgi:hypothetical protein
MRNSKRALAACLLMAGATATPAVAAKCYYTGEWRAQHSNSESDLIKEVKRLEDEVSNEGALTLEQVLGAAKVLNTQHSGEEQRLQQVVKKSEEAYAESVNAQTRNERIVEIKEQYGYETGQGVNACAQRKFLSSVNAAITGATAQTSKIYKDLDVAPGSVPSLEEQARDRLDGSSTDASVLLRDGSVSDKQKVIQHIAGLALNKPSSREEGTVGGQFMFIRARQAEAWRSPALLSLSTVAGVTDKSGGDADSAGSMMQAMDEIVNNYGGGPAYAKWTNGLQMQSERGLLTELNTLRAMSVSLRKALMDSEARKAAVMAGLLAAEASQ